MKRCKGRQKEEQVTVIVVGKEVVRDKVRCLFLPLGQLKELYLYYLQEHTQVIN